MPLIDQTGVPEGYERIPGYEHMRTFPEGEAIVSMIQFNGRALVATSLNVYEIKDGKLVRILLLEVEPDAPA